MTAEIFVNKQNNQKVSTEEQFFLMFSGHVLRGSRNNFSFLNGGAARRFGRQVFSGIIFSWILDDTFLGLHKASNYWGQTRLTSLLGRSSEGPDGSARATWASWDKPLESDGSARVTWASWDEPLESDGSVRVTWTSWVGPGRAAAWTFGRVEAEGPEERRLMQTALGADALKC